MPHMTSSKMRSAPYFWQTAWTALKYPGTEGTHPSACVVPVSGRPHSKLKQGTHGSYDGLSNESADRLWPDGLEFVIQFLGQSVNVLVVRLTKILAAEAVAWRHPAGVLHQHRLKLFPSGFMAADCESSEGDAVVRLPAGNEACPLVLRWAQLEEVLPGELDRSLHRLRALCGLAMSYPKPLTRDTDLS